MLTTFTQVLVSGFAIGGIYALIALSFSITFTVTKTLNFAQGDFVAFGAFIGVTLLAVVASAPAVSAIPSDAFAGWRYPLGVTFAGLMTGVLGIMLFLLAVRPFTGKQGMNWVMSSIGFGIILQSVGMGVWGPETIHVPAPFGDKVIRFFGAGFRPQELLVFLVAVVIMIVLDVAMHRTMIGKAMLAVAHSPSTASLMGIRVDRMMLGAFFISTALAGISGILIAPIATASLFMGFSFALKAFSGAILGGLASPRGCILGGFLLGLFESCVGLWHSAWREIAIFLLIIVVLALRPKGLFGRVTVEKV